MNNYQKSKIEKVGKYFRPIFWSYFTVFFSVSLIKILREAIFISPTWKVIGWFFGLFLILFSLVATIFGIYRITHPYIGKEDYDSGDEGWGVAAYFLLLFLIIYLPLKYYFGIDILEYIFRRGL